MNAKLSNEYLHLQRAMMELKYILNLMTFANAHHLLRVPLVLNINYFFLKYIILFIVGVHRGSHSSFHIQEHSREHHS